MGRLIARRLLTAVPTLLAIIILSFILMRVAPGGPFDGERPLAPEVRAALEAAYGLDKSLPEQVWMYLTRLVQAISDRAWSIAISQFPGWWQRLCRYRC